MKERPILFSASMVRAILDGRKTQTRRVMKPQPKTSTDERGGHSWPSNPHQSMLHVEHELQNTHEWRDITHLWVRETWKPDAPRDGTWADVQFYGCRTSPLSEIPERFRSSSHCLYKSTWEGSELVGWKPSIHMPRWASRITLEITGVRVERLQDISRGDAMDEGCPFPNMAQGDDPRKWYADLWESLNGKGSWDANPWVWIIEFRRR